MRDSFGGGQHGKATDAGRRSVAQPFRNSSFVHFMPSVQCDTHMPPATSCFAIRDAVSFLLGRSRLCLALERISL